MSTTRTDNVPRLRVLQAEGSETIFHVEGNTVQCICPGCSKLFNRVDKPDLFIGGKCPKCGGKLDVRFHQVDLAAFNGNGACACEFFQFTKAPKLRRLPPAEQAMHRHECHHIRAARNFLLDLMLKRHEQERMKPFARGRREEDQP